MTPVEAVDIVGIEKESNEIVVKANNFEITTDAVYIEAMEFAKTIKIMQKEVEGAFNPIVQKANAAWKEAIAQKNKYLEPLEKALKFLDTKVRTFRAEQERIRLIEEREAQELSRKEAERLKKLADKAMARGDADKASLHEARAQEVASIIPVIAPKVSKVSGVVIRKVWKFQVMDVNLVPREYMTPNMELLGSTARGTKGTLQIPGIRFYAEDSSL